MDTKPPFVIENDDCIANIKQIGIIWVDKVLHLWTFKTPTLF